MKILTVATAWGSQHGGLNVFNYRLCCNLAKHGIDVSCYVKSFSGTDHQNATSNKITLHALGSPQTKWTNQDVGLIDHKIANAPRVVIIHDIVTSEFLRTYRQGEARPLIVAFIHTHYKETDYLYEEDVQTRLKSEAQKELIEYADLTFTSGPWLAEQLKARHPELADKIQSFTPGKEEFEPKGPDVNGTITVLGRLSFANRVKQASSVLQAYEKLAKKCQIDRDFELPNLVLLGADLAHEEITELKIELGNQFGPLPKVEFLPYEPNHDFVGSQAHKVLTTSKLVVTPSLVETFGLASLEAACMGIPLITTRRSGFGDDVTTRIPASKQAIQWLSPSDFEDLPSTLAEKATTILKDYDRHAQLALELAREMQGPFWPTWREATRRLASAITNHISSRVSAPANESRLTKVHAFGDLDKLDVGRLPAREEMMMPGPFDGSPTQPPASPPTAPLVDLARATYGDNLVYHPSLREMIEARYGASHCTPLQEALLREVSDRPHKYRDFILCGGTSSGKTVAAELLFGLANDLDFPMSRILYITPTRALAQERHRDWSSKFDSLNPPGWKQNVILSTGEDHSNDGALSRGAFMVACIVYEKANVILSTSANLLERLTMVVVDELHMIGDIHRGPILETLLAKVKQEKARRQRQSNPLPPIRIVGITTEQRTADDFANYFANEDPQNDRTIPPLRVTDVGRPTSVTHVLVELYSDGHHNYRLTPIATFGKGALVQLDEDAYAEFARRLPPPAMVQTGARIEYVDRYIDFIMSWFFANPEGRRLLVFIGSKVAQLELAERLKNKVAKNYTLAQRPLNTDAMEPIEHHLRRDDTSLAAPVLARCLPRGILVHSADLSRSLRKEIEDYLGQPLKSGAGSEVIISTETLSYGVNLSIDDVAILSMEFPASERHQEDGASRKRLSHCAFSNMCGRAGRLNQTGNDPTVYVWPITDFGHGSLELVKYFYGEADESPTSKIFHADDREAFERIEEDPDDRTRAPMLFTYPLVRTVLDGLRYIGGAPGMSGAITAPATFREISRNFSRHLLYFHETKDDSKKERLNESVELIIDGSMGSEFDLVKKSGAGYKITELGSSIIDTGTEISTLAPLKGALEALLQELREVPMHDVPVEALLLPILVQNEAHRQVFLRMPEIRSEVAEGENRKALLAWIGDNFAHLGFTSQVTAALEGFLARCDADPKHAPCDTRESQFVHDSCLRLFCGLMLWVSGHSIADIHVRLRSIGKITGGLVDLNTNFSIFAERISWKLLFLGNLMRFSRGQNDLRMLQTKTRRLIVRLRLGCAEEALPFLSVDGQGDQPVERRVAHLLLGKGASAKTVCSGDFDVDAVAPGQAQRVRAQVQNFIRASFERIKEEFVFKALDDEIDDLSEDYWDFAEKIIASYVTGEEPTVAWPGKFRDASYTTTGHSAANAPLLVPWIQIIEEAGALKITGHSVQWQEDKANSVPVLQWYVQAAYGSAELKPAPDGHISVVIDFPWLLRADPVESGMIRMSPAAFGILFTLIARSFLSDPVAALSMITNGETAISSETLLNELYAHLVLTQIPEPIFDAWAGYWDAD